MSYKPDYECTQEELKIRAWAHAGSFGIIATLLSSAVLGIAMLLGAKIDSEVFAWTIFSVVFVVVGIARLWNQVPSPAEQAAKREIAENGGYSSQHAVTIGRTRDGMFSPKH